MNKKLLFLALSLLLFSKALWAQKNVSMYLDYSTVAQNPNGYVWNFRSNTTPTDTMVLQYSGMALGVRTNRDTIIDPVTGKSYRYPSNYTIDSVQFEFLHVNYSGQDDTIGIDIVGLLANGYPDLNNVLKREYIVTNNNSNPMVGTPQTWTNASYKYIVFHPNLQLTQKCAIMLRYNAPTSDTLFVKYSYTPGAVFAQQSVFDNSFCNLAPYITNLTKASTIRTGAGDPYYLQDQDWLYPYISFTVPPTSYDTVNASTCQNNPYIIGNSAYTTSGTYTNTIVNYLGGDSVVTLNLTVNPTSTTTINTAICQGNNYMIDTFIYNTTGSYVNYLTNYLGCDSIVYLNLLVNNTSASTITTSICQGSTYSVGTIAYNTSGTHITTLTNSVGCDSIVTLNLTVNPISNKVINTGVCLGSSYTVGSNSYSTAGNYVNHLTNYLGCDSTVVLNLTIYQPSTNTINASICQGSSYTVGTNTYNSPGTYTTHLTNKYGCDSAVTLTLAILPSSTNTINATICQGDSYTVGAIIYTTAGTYVNHLNNYLGCDSAITLNLTLNAQPSTPTITASNCELICDSVATSYQWYKAGVLITGANSQAYTISTSGFYSVEVTNAAGCAKASAPVYFTCAAAGLENVNNNTKMEVFPNPFQTSIMINFNQKVTKGELLILNSLGQTLKTQKVENSNSEKVDLSSLAEGFYYVQLKSINNNQIIKISKTN